MLLSVLVILNSNAVNGSIHVILFSYFELFSKDRFSDMELLARGLWMFLWLHIDKLLYEKIESVCF